MVSLNKEHIKKLFITLLFVFFFFPLSFTVSCIQSSEEDDDPIVYYRDTDGDGFGDPADSLTDQSGPPEGYVVNDDDCDDTDASVNPNADEVCDDDKDNDCNGSVDEGCDTIDPNDVDDDGDDYTENEGDCDDTDDDIYPGAVETCGDNIDQDCDGSDLDCPPEESTYYRDADGDGYGDPNDSVTDSSQPSGYLTNSNDCDDTDASIHPGAAEICGDTIDQNCDGADTACPPSGTYFRDGDGDGFGDPNESITTTDTTPPDGYVTDNTDFDDNDATSYPGAAELCDSVDNNGDGSVDEGCTIYYRDGDGDSFGDANDTVTDTSLPTGYVTDSTDCDDTDAGIYPGAAEIINDGIDQDCNGVDQPITFEKTFGGGLNDFGLEVRQMSDGGYILIGNTLSFGAGSADLYVVRTDENGNELWSATYGGSGLDEGASVLQTQDGGYLFFGRTNSSGAGLMDMFLIKTDATGIEQWNKTYGGAADEDGLSVKTAQDGGYVLLGDSNSFGAGGQDYDTYLIKVDPSGNELWSKRYGGPGDERGREIQPTTDGGYIIFADGEFNAAGEKDMTMIKTDVSGVQEWYSTFGGVTKDWCNSGLQVSDGYLALGLTNSYGAGLDDMYLVKADVNGNAIWGNTFGGVNNERGASIKETSDGKYIITGKTASFGNGVAGSPDVFLLKVDTSGNEVWSKTYGGSDSEAAQDIQITSDGGYIIIGKTRSYGAGGFDMYLIKTDADGNVY